VLAVGVLAQAAMSAYHQGLPAIGPALEHHFGISLVQTGALFSAVAIGVTLGLVPWGLLADRIGERLVLVAGLGSAALALGAAALAGGYVAAFVALMAAGLFGSCANAASGRAVMAWFGARERGTALGLRQTATPLGGALAAIALPLIVLRSGVAGAFWALAAFCLLAAAACGLALRRGQAQSSTAVTGPSPLRDRRLWRLAVGGALIVAGQLSLISYLVIFLSEDRHLALAAAALVLTACQLGGAAARVAAGAWSDRLRARIRPMRVLALAGAGLLAAMALFAQAPLVLVIPLAVACTVVNMSTNGLAFTATGEVAGQRRAGTAMGFQNTWLFISGAIGPIVFGAIVTGFGWRVGFAFLVVTALAGWSLLAPLVREEARAWRRPA
jgi:sugar phosphate permease